MKRLVFIAFALSVIMASCTEGYEEARLSIRLVDGPADYEEVLIDIKDVKINYSNDEEGWTSLGNVKKGVYNLLEFTNGLDTLLAEENIPAGSLLQMRLVLGDNNQLKKDGKYYHLDTPSAEQSGLKYNVHAELKDGITHRIWIDFDAGRSIVEKGNGKFSLKPVIRTFTEVTSGAIKGMVNPVAAKPYIMAISSDNDTIGTYADGETGYFMLRGLRAGSYNMECDPVDGYIEKDIENIEVSVGNVTDLDVITFDME